MVCFFLDFVHGLHRKFESAPDPFGCPERMAMACASSLLSLWPGCTRRADGQTDVSRGCHHSSPFGRSMERRRGKGHMHLCRVSFKVSPHLIKHWGKRGHGPARACPTVARLRGHGHVSRNSHRPQNRFSVRPPLYFSRRLGFNEVLSVLPYDVSEVVELARPRVRCVWGPRWVELPFGRMEVGVLTVSGNEINVVSLFARSRGCPFLVRLRVLWLPT